MNTFFRVYNLLIFTIFSLFRDLCWVQNSFQFFIIVEFFFKTNKTIKTSQKPFRPRSYKHRKSMPPFYQSESMIRVFQNNSHWWTKYVHGSYWQLIKVNNTWKWNRTSAISPSQKEQLNTWTSDLHTVLKTLLMSIYRRTKQTITPNK